MSAHEPSTFAAAWQRAVFDGPSRPFLTFEGPSGEIADWTYGEFDGLVNRAMATLRSEGVVQGSAVHLALTNSPTFIAVWLAAVRLGAWIVPSDPMSRAPELADHISRTEPVVGFCAESRAEPYVEAAGSMRVIRVDESDTELRWLGGTIDVVPGDPTPRDRAAVMFTSGTTGRPKGVEITQANYAFAGQAMAGASGLTSEDRQIVVLPLFHANAQYYSFASAIAVGASVALMHTFSASGFLPQVARHGATCASLFAAPMRMILARGEKVEGVALRHCWYAQNITPEQHKTLTDWFGCPPRQLYGMTETIPAVLTDTGNDPLSDSMGFVTDGCTVALHGPDGAAVSDGDIGEIVVNGVPGETLFAGYLDDERTTVASFRDGWFLTGDRARRDPDGRWYFDGRRSDVLKVSGENVSTVEVEAVITAHPAVLEASVIGAPDDVRDEVPVAFVVASDPTAPPTVQDLTNWCAERLSKPKVPTQFTFLNELPRTSVGKIRKFLLKEKTSL
ncbi:AMP-binding protein [Ilumatobacteraceae bacterium]|nr:AMP-binding protein [Ilumatobacteraceae bacterium]